MSSLKLKILRTSPDAQRPTKGTTHAACFDLYATRVEKQGLTTRVYGTDLRVEIPEGHCMLIYGRSGLAFKDDLRLGNCVAVIDSDYRGEIMVKLTADRPSEVITEAYWPKIGQRIAQFMIVPVPEVEIEEVDGLEDTVRGEGGFGSTGA